MSELGALSQKYGITNENSDLATEVTKCFLIAKTCFVNDSECVNFLLVWHETLLLGYDCVW